MIVASLEIIIFPDHSVESSKDIAFYDKDTSVITSYEQYREFTKDEMRQRAVLARVLRSPM